ncbi:hypothetical protein GobsT_24700 [Gemmata obscuriglobus]|nr:hypothetical protein GobsT_24700 [Gemmata obscuriglobus]VTS04946.1 unnamed protein product [Gemmata obscuriglobus UQM 2246]
MKTALRSPLSGFQRRRTRGACRQPAHCRQRLLVLGGLVSPARVGFLVFVTVALLALPIFAHGCHGDDVDHEPLFVPFRLNADDR